MRYWQTAATKERIAGGEQQGTDHASIDICDETQSDDECLVVGAYLNIYDCRSIFVIVR